MVQHTRSNHTFYLHAGGVEVEPQELRNVVMPAATKTYTPVPHWNFLQEVTGALQNFGYGINEAHHALSQDGQRYFGLLLIPGPPGASRDFEWAVGLRNSSDKSIACRLALGTRVFVCDNLAFSGEIVAERKHTSRVFADLPLLISETVGKLRKTMIRDDVRRVLYEEREINDAQAHDVMVNAVRFNVISAPMLPAIVQEWHEPTHEEFADRNVWSLFNAFTSTRNQNNAGAFIKRGNRMHAMFDGLFQDVDFTQAVTKMEKQYATT